MLPAVDNLTAPAMLSFVTQQARTRAVPYSAPADHTPEGYLRVRAANVAAYAARLAGPASEPAWEARR